MTTLEPGASEVLTQGLRVRPRARALRATSPAAIITSGFEVLVQLVMAAMTTDPWVRGKRVPSSSTGTTSWARAPTPTSSHPQPLGGQVSLAVLTASVMPVALSPPSPAQRLTPTDWAGTGLSKVSVSSLCHWAFMLRRSTRSCGRLGPASEGTTLDRSSSTTELNTGSGVDGSQKKPASRAHASVRRSSCSVLAVRRK